MASLNIYTWEIFATILFLTFALFLLVTGAFTAYFGSGKSRKIGGGLLAGGLVLGFGWGWAVGPGKMVQGVDLLGIVPQVVLIILAAIIGAVAAIGVFLVAIMKS